jgi:hypothetical protein
MGLGHKSESNGRIARASASDPEVAEERIPTNESQARSAAPGSRYLAKSAETLRTIAVREDGARRAFAEGSLQLPEFGFCSNSKERCLSEVLFK